MKKPAALLLSLAACTPAAPLSPPADGDLRTVYVVAHGSHAGLAVKASDIPQGLWPEKAEFPDARYLEVGWGDRDFYQQPDFSFLSMLKAGLWPTPSVLLVQPLPASPEQRYPCSEIVALHASAQRFGRLAQFIHDSFDRAGAQRAAPLPPSYPQPGRFFPARGRFHAFRTCNVWTAHALNAAGYQIGWPYPLTAGGLLDEIQPLGHAIAPTPFCRPP